MTTKKIRQVLMDCLAEETDGESLKKKLVQSLIRKAISGDVRAFETVAKFIGEYPSKQQTIETDEEIKKSSLWSL